MFKRKDDICIVMRTFWPVSPVVGEGMMCVAEKLSYNVQCSVITQDQSGLRAKLEASNRGGRTSFLPIKALSTSSSGMVVRILDTLWFSLACFLMLLLRRPRLIYVATDPPILVPFVIFLYAKLFSAQYVYHVQDIHPEATAIVFPSLKGKLYSFLRWIDAKVVQRASIVITLTSEMRESLISRKGDLDNIALVSNPSADVKYSSICESEFDFSFVGNAGRLQRIPLLMRAIEKHLEGGGRGRFAFAGAGVMSVQLKELAARFPLNVHYPGKVSVDEATRITQSSKWAILSIDDDVCKYAFPSKAATYAVSGRGILAVCGQETSVAKWINQHNLGSVIEPELDSVTQFFDSVNSSFESESRLSDDAFNSLRESLSTEMFVENITNIILDEYYSTV